MPKILLVDDVELFLELERSYLDGCGYDLVTASSGEETLKRLDRANHTWRISRREGTRAAPTRSCWDWRRVAFQVPFGRIRFCLTGNANDSANTWLPAARVMTSNSSRWR